ncbi:hypothetical protein [Rhodohalobacter mucosus]|uniref:Gfo/Idh/MocA-like oxidoreductase N-terminal domain-containing protein n=1 Tax=Rhodohalobacter mucosus TaxID=2079485 RepID=A0A316TSJ6_9BACT|nr:hypothetical protein [Rhodohalobacter mucosus]PWN06611.1 hypothetical protein DDZ15_08835 [Rhodohalobacter mucosus]
MKVAVIGEKSRASAWEKHLRKLSVIKEVILSSSLFEDQNLRTVILVEDDPKTSLHLLDQSIRSGLNSFLVSRLPVDIKKLEQIYHISSEAGVTVQFSHWPSITPSTQWIRQQIQKPDLIQIKKEVRPLNYTIDKEMFDHHWTDEVAFIVKWMGGNVHRIEAKPVILEGTPLGLSLSMRFEDASVASIQFSGFSQEERHQRLFSDQQTLIDCNVLTQKMKAYRVNENKRITVQEKAFDPSDTAEWALQQFIKSIQMKRESIFSPYDALLTARIVEKVRNHMEKW